MELIPAETHIDFLKRAPQCAAISIGAILISAIMWVYFGGFKLGIEFAGGQVIEVEFPEAPAGVVTTADVRSALSTIGFPDASVVGLGTEDETDFQISLNPSDERMQSLLGLASSPAAGASNGVSATPATDAAKSSGAAPSDETPAPDETPGADAAAGSEAEPAQVPADSEAASNASSPAEAESATTDRDGAAADAAASGGQGAEPAAAEPDAAAGAASSEGDGALTPMQKQDALVGLILSGLSKQTGQTPRLSRIETIGPRVSEELTQQGFLAVFIVGVLILAYIALRFDMRYAPGAVVALMHDITITAGVFVIFQFEFNLQVLAALLAVLGYSLNDTIVVYDRIRENVERRGVVQLGDVINESVNQTLSRSLLTSFTTLLVVLALLFFGGPVIRDFAIAMFVGIVVGTYSSIYVASALLLFIQNRWKAA